jgi:protein-L-isoaspartate(D-aspartate) O-methyltransferase
MTEFPELKFKEQIVDRGIKDPRVMSVMRNLSRENFVPERLKSQAYQDAPLPIGSNQTISQPYIVALMSEAAALRGQERILEIGTGCGYQTAVLAKLAQDVYTVEIREELQITARANLAKLFIENVHFKVGDGNKGFPEAAPFSAIIVTAAAPKVPEALLSQLEDGGRLIIPVGRDNQVLLRITRQGETFSQENLLNVRFVPLIESL